MWGDFSDTYLQELRMEFRYDMLLKGIDCEIEKVLILTNWVSNLWKHSMRNSPTNDDPISILREVKEGKRFRCVEYSKVLSACLNSIGIPSRTVGLLKKNCEYQIMGDSHVVVEAYIKRENKWVFIDPQWNVIPFLNQRPLNSIEFQSALTLDENIDLRSKSNKDKKRYKRWIYRYLYYMYTNVDNRAIKEKSTRIMLVPVGANYPKVFARKYVFEDIIYTHSALTYYKAPQ